MTFDSERISRKQDAYEKSRAYETISVLRCKSLSYKEILGCIEVMSRNIDNSETEAGVLAKAHKIVTLYIEQENTNASNPTNNPNTNSYCELFLEQSSKL